MMMHGSRLLAVALLFAVPPRMVEAAVLCVNPGGTGGCFSAVQAALDSAASGDTIQVAAGTYNENLSINVNVPFADSLDKITIEGAGAVSTIIDGGGTDRVLVSVGCQLTMSGVTLQNGNSIGAIFHDHGGCANIAARSRPAVLSGVVVRNCTAVEGGGLRLTGRARIERSTITGNSASYGGGVFVAGGPTTVEIVDSTISGNGADNGGGIYAVASRLRVLNSTVSGNTATDCCGGLRLFYNAGNTKIRGSTITDNSAGSCGGGLCLHKRRTLIVGSIVAGNSSGGIGPDCVSSSDPSLTSGGFNLFGNTSDCTIRGRSSLDIVGADPMLGALADNGGPTETHALLAGSPAIDMGTPEIGKALLLCTPFDQRGFPRNGRCDIGAYEF